MSYDNSQGIGYRSTNNRSQITDFGTAILTGLAPDKGLYMPTSIPRTPPSFFKSAKRMTIPEIAAQVITPYTDIPGNKMEEMMHDAYNFEIPIENVGRRHIVRMDRGPTLSFKDIGMRPFARMMQYELEERGRRAVIITATSGDTGSAGADAFYGLDNIIYIVLFPENEVSARQRKLMTTLSERKSGKNNVFAFAGRETFDYYQTMAKQVLGDPELRSFLDKYSTDVSSANSVNFGRLVSQQVQYIYAHSRIALLDEEIVFSVPCGNFGHLTAGIMSQRAGLPVYRFVAAVNENDEFPRYLNTGKYEPVVPSKNCLSNSMNVGDPSNLARVFDLYGGMLDEKGKVIKNPDISRLREDVFSTSVNDKETNRTILNVFQKHGIVLEPHGAVAWSGSERFAKSERDGYSDGGDIDMPHVIFETADPWKFPNEVRNAIGKEPETPDSMKSLDMAKESYRKINNADELKQFITQLF